ncbi:hypothetical protein [Aquimonas sp.]|jgi:hypothetical protein|uniref:hypothetical protein n=1 Tax=Aquimonas sp. TaxID=1872588 RepID=UPI0037C02F3C
MKRLPMMALIALTGLASPLAFASICEGDAGMLRNASISGWAAGHEDLASTANVAHVLGTRPSEALSLSAVLLRRQLAGCAEAGDAYAGYVPRTEHDNTPWRFNMDAGKKLSAAEFDAWMKSRGVRVARGRTEPAAVPVEEAATVAQ